MTLTTFLNDIKMQGRVIVSQKEIAEHTKLSNKTIISAIEELEILGYISHTGKQVYTIHPKLAWFGKQADWAIALKQETLTSKGEIK